MNVNDVPRIAAPLLIAAAIAVSFGYQTPVPPAVELPAGDVPEPPAAVIDAALARALDPGAPGYDRGATRAPVTVIEFADFGCRYCASFAAETYPRLAAEFVASGKVRWRYVPFVLGMFSNGQEAARAAECAAEQGPAAFGAMHDRLFAQRESWMRASDPATALRRFAISLGLDEGRFAACFSGSAADIRVRASSDLADRLGVRSTPTFFVNGARVEGALPAADFRAVLLEALRQSQSPARTP